MSRRSHRQREAAVSFFSFQDIIASITGIMLLITLLLTLELITRKEGQGAEAPPPRIADLRQAIEEKQKQLDALEAQAAGQQQLVNELADGMVVTAEQVEDLKHKVAVVRGGNSDKQARVEALEKQRDELKGKIAVLDERLAKLGGALRDAREQAQHAQGRPNIDIAGGQAWTKKLLLVEVDRDVVTVAEVMGGGELKTLQRCAGRGGPVRPFVDWLRSRSAAQEGFVFVFRPGGVAHFGSLVGAVDHKGFDVGWDVWPPGNWAADKPLLNTP